MEFVACLLSRNLRRNQAAAISSRVATPASGGVLFFPWPWKWSRPDSALEAGPEWDCSPIFPFRWVHCHSAPTCSGSGTAALARTLLDVDIGGPDHLAPLRDLAVLEGGVLAGRGADEIETQRGCALGDVG